MSDVEIVAHLNGKMHGSMIKATASVFVALISVLVRKGVISAETAETEILNVLEETYRSLPPPESEADREMDDLESNTALHLVEVIRRRLFQEP